MSNSGYNVVKFKQIVIVTQYGIYYIVLLNSSYNDAMAMY
jgi:hypothetical protein